MWRERPEMREKARTRSDSGHKGCASSSLPRTSRGRPSASLMDAHVWAADFLALSPIPTVKVAESLQALQR